MKKVFVLYNPKSGNATGEKESRKLDGYIEAEFVFCDITKNINYTEFFSRLEKEDIVIVAGGDGTLSRFADSVAQLDIKNDVYYYATGSGNDFLKDVDFVKGDKPFLINEYIKSLPVMTINGIKMRFVNGVGGGLDAYACAESNRLHAKGKKANYVAVAIKGILYDYKPMNAKVIVDGEKYEFKNVWFASVMKGRYFGGGIMLAPNQDRKKDTLSVVVVHSVGRLRLLPIIPGAFNGKHVKYTQYVKIIEGDSIEVIFDRPVPVQADGETASNISGYSVSAKQRSLQY